MNTRRKIFVLVFIAVLVLSTVPVLPVIAQDGGRPWFKVIGGQYSDKAYSIAFYQGSIYVTGYTGSYSMQRWYKDVFVAKLDPDGNLQWFKTISGNMLNERAKSIAVYQGNIYVAGYANIYGSGTSDDAFVAKLDLNGNLQWFKTIGDQYTDRAYSMAVDQGYIYLAGYTDRPGNDPADVFVAKFDLNGNLQWFKTIGESGDYKYEEAYSVVVYEGNIYVAGYTESYSDSYDAFIAKLDSDGNLLWFKTIGLSDEDEWVNSIAVYQGNIYVAGRAEGNAFIAKLDLDGNLQWFKRMEYVDEAYSITIYQGSIYVTGDSGLYRVGYNDAFIAKFDLDGNLQWFKTMGMTRQFTLSYSIVVQSNIYIAGVSLGNVLVAKLDETFVGELCWTRGEPWPKVQVVEHQPTISSQAPSEAFRAPPISEPVPNKMDYTDQFQSMDHSPGQHLATVLEPPVADFTWSPVEPVAGQAVTFDASSSYDPDGNIVQYQWDFGDGHQAQGQVVQHVYDMPGTYDVTLTVTDDDGLTDEITKQVTVEQPLNPYMLTLGTRRPETLAGLSYSDGNAYIAGTTNRRMPYLASFDAFTGQLNFAKIFQVRRRAAVDGVRAIVDGAFVMGHYRRAFMAKFSQSGEPEWLLELGSGRRVTRINDMARYCSICHQIGPNVRNLEVPAGHPGPLNGEVIYVVGQWDGTRRGTRGKAFIARVDDWNGQVEWIKAIDTRRGDAAKALWVTEDSIYVIGTTYSRGRGDVFVAKLDHDGNLQDYVTFGGRRLEKVEGAIYYDGYLYIVGDTKSFGRDKVFVAKLPLDFGPLNGGIVKIATLDIGRREHSFGIAEGSIYIAGQTGRDSFIVKLSPDTLEVQDAKLIRGPRFILARGIAYQNAILLAGCTSIGEGRGDAFLGLIPDDFEGIITWPEGWHVSISGFEPAWQSFDLQAIPGTPNVYELDGYSVREFNAWDWPAMIHMSTIGE